MLLFRLSGVLSFRFAVRRLIGLLFQDPPRSTVAHPRFTARADRALPTTNEPSDFIREPGGMLVLIHAQQPQLARKSQVRPKRGQLAVGIHQPRATVGRRAEERAVEPEGRLLDVARQHEALSPREPRSRRQHPFEQIVRFREDRRFGGHGAAENTNRESNAWRRRNVWPNAAWATHACTDAVSRVAGRAPAAKTRW